MKSALPPGVQAKLYDMLLAAHKGDAKLSWLHGLVQRAGYVRYDGGQDTVLVTAKQLEQLLGKSIRSVRMMIREGLPCARPGVGAVPSLFDVKAVMEWVAVRDGATNGNGEKSAALEEYRREKAREAKRRNDRADELLVEVETVGMIHDSVGRVWRRRVKNLERLHGPSVAASISDMVEDAFGRLKKGVEAAKKSRGKA